MIIKSFVKTPYMNFVDIDELNKELYGACHIETYSIDEKMYGGHHTIYITAFYPDKERIIEYVPSKELWWTRFKRLLSFRL